MGPGNYSRASRRPQNIEWGKRKDEGTKCHTNLHSIFFPERRRYLYTAAILHESGSPAEHIHSSAKHSFTLRTKILEISLICSSDTVYAWSDQHSTAQERKVPKAERGLTTHRSKGDRVAVMTINYSR